MSRNADERYQSVGDFEEALAGFVGIVTEEKPRELWRRYVADPDAVNEELRTAVISTYTTRGIESTKAGDSIGAINAFNRVLAYDESNETVLRALDQMGRRYRLRRTASVGFGAAMMIAGIVLLWPTLSALVGGAESREAIAIQDAVGEGESEQASSSSSRETPANVQDAQVPDPESAQEQAVSASAISADAAAALGANGNAADGGEIQTPSVPELAGSSTRAPASSAPRLVRFVPSLQNVSISVDGAPPRPFGPSFQNMLLAPGRHRFQITGEQVQTLTVARTIQPGTGSVSIPFRLQLKPARLYVRANGNGDVAVSGGARGRTRSFITVPMTQSAADVTITVTSPGHRMYRGRQRIVAGRQVNHVARLEPIAAAPSE